MILEEAIWVNWGICSEGLVKSVELEYIKQSSARIGNDSWGSHVSELMDLWQRFSQICYFRICSARSGNDSLGSHISDLRNLWEVKKKWYWKYENERLIYDDDIWFAWELFFKMVYYKGIWWKAYHNWNDKYEHQWTYMVVWINVSEW